MSAKEIWEVGGLKYEAGQERYAQERYPQHVFRYRRVYEMLTAAIGELQASKPNAPWQLLDIGCGYGDILRWARARGAEAHGIDYSSSMVEAARTALAADGISDVTVNQADARDLSLYPDASMDVVCAIQIFGYMARADEKKYLGECHRVLRPGGALITAEINGIFDVATFNRFTVNFFRDNLLPIGFKDESARAQMTQEIAALVHNPTMPAIAPPVDADKMSIAIMLDGSETRFGSHRDQAGTKPENPLDYKNTVGRHGFSLEDLAFYRFHLVPPLLFRKHPELEQRAQEVEDEHCRSWQAHFMASSFVARSKKR
jgi:ubiquinone/menaquinone biosynthesis C-methylase UbiE